MTSESTFANDRCRNSTTATMQQTTPRLTSPRLSARGQTAPPQPSASPQPSGRRSPGRLTPRGASVSSTLSSTRTEMSSTTVLGDVFDIVADGNADMLAEMIAFSGAQHMAELRSKKQEDYGQNLLHCAVASGQLSSLKVLLQHADFDPNQVDSAYTRSTPMMEAVKIGGRLDLIECLIAAGGRLDVQDVNGDSVLHWAAREISAAFLRNVLYLARKHGRTVPELLAALQLKNNNGENAADVGANDVARESIRRLVSGEEHPGLPAKRMTSTNSRQSGGGVGGANRNISCVSGGGPRLSPSPNSALKTSQPGSSGLRPSRLSTSGLRSCRPGSPTGMRPSQSGGFTAGWTGGNPGGHQRQSPVSSKKGQQRLGSVAAAVPPTTSHLVTTGGPASTGRPAVAVSGASTTPGSSPDPLAGEAVVPSGKEAASGVVDGAEVARLFGHSTMTSAGKSLTMTERLLPKLAKAPGGHPANAGEAPTNLNNDRVRASSTPFLPSSP